MWHYVSSILKSKLTTTLLRECSCFSQTSKMQKFKAQKFNYKILAQNCEYAPIFPFLRDNNGNEQMHLVSPEHGRSFLMHKDNNERYIISKGNGLSYTQCQFLHTAEFGNDTLGLLLLKDALRDFHCGIEISKLGIKTNKMQYVLELDKTITLINGYQLKPILLQYSVECPYRLSDAHYINRDIITKEVNKWERFNTKCFDKMHLVAADVLIKNLRILHNHKILHNALTPQNYTWALELLDFELTHTPNNPYDSEDDCRHVKDLFDREIFYVYQIINLIAGILRENIDYKEIDDLFHQYDFNIDKYKV